MKTNCHGWFWYRMANNPRNTDCTKFMHSWFTIDSEFTQGKFWVQTYQRQGIIIVLSSIIIQYYEYFMHEKESTQWTLSSDIQNRKEIKKNLVSPCSTVMLSMWHFPMSHCRAFKSYCDILTALRLILHVENYNYMAFQRLHGISVVLDNPVLIYRRNSHASSLYRKMFRNSDIFDRLVW